MTDPELTILQVNTSDRGGGAEVVAMRLHNHFRRLGHDAWFLAGRRSRAAEGVIEPPPGLGFGPWGGTLLAWRRRLSPLMGRIRGAGRLAAMLDAAARPGGALERRRGREDFDFPSPALYPGLCPRKPAVVHLHNMHGGYFSLPGLPALCAGTPVVLTLHDCWLFSGHCAHSLECNLWMEGCGSCPDLDLYPRIRRDATAFNWLRKKRILENCRLHVTAPSTWLLERAKQSILAPAMASGRVIENGVDDAFFNAPERSEARERLGLPGDAPVLTFIANSPRRNPWKDYASVRAAFENIAAQRPGAGAVLLVLGDGPGEERMGDARIVFVPFQADPAAVALHLAASDVYLHAAHAETFSLTIAEAQAAKTPVVAALAGATLERIKPLAHNTAPAGLRVHSTGEATGMLVPPIAATALAQAVMFLLDNPEKANLLAANAAMDAASRYNSTQQAGRYLELYSEILSASHNK